VAAQVAHEKADLVAVAVAAVAAVVVVAPAAVAAVAGADFPAEPSRDPPGLHAFVGL
jgi:hypothetical protein